MPDRIAYQDFARSLEGTFFSVRADQVGILANFEVQVTRLEPVRGVSSGDEANQRNYTTLEVPNLVALAGAARAETLLKRVFAPPIHGATIKDAGTKALARRVASGMGGDLKFAPWSLVDELDPATVTFYEAINRRFPADSTNSNNETERNQAGGYYLFGLIAGGRYDEAAKSAVERVDAMGRQNE